MLPIGDPAILWPHTVCLNTIVHRFRYTLTVAVCVRVPRKSTGIGYCFTDDRDESELDDGQDQEYDLQLLSRHVHVSFGRNKFFRRALKACFLISCFFFFFYVLFFSVLVLAFLTTLKMSRRCTRPPAADVWIRTKDPGSDLCIRPFVGQLTITPRLVFYFILLKYY